MAWIKLALWIKHTIAMEFQVSNEVAKKKFTIERMHSPHSIRSKRQNKWRNISRRRQHQSKHKRTYNIYKSLIKYRFFIICLHLFDQSTETTSASGASTILCCLDNIDGVGLRLTEWRANTWVGKDRLDWSLCLTKQWKSIYASKYICRFVSSGECRSGAAV